MRLLSLLVRLGIQFGRIPIRLILGIASAILRRLMWLRPVAKLGFNLVAGVRSNSVAKIAITLSVVNFGLLMWQVWPEGTGQTIAPSHIAAENLETSRFEETASGTTELEDRIGNTAGKIIELENRIRDLSKDQQFQIDRLRDCINYPSPFGCQ